REQADGDVAGAEQEGRVDGSGDEQRGVDGRLQAHRDAGEHHGGRSGPGALPDLADRAAVGLGEVPGEQLDRRGEEQADEDRADRDEPGVAVQGGDLGGDALQGGEGGGQVEQGRDHHEDGGDDRRDEEAAVDRRHGVAVAGAGRHHEDADDRGDDADHRDQQREDQSFDAEGDPAQDEGGDEDHRVGLEQVGGHSRAVADVVAHVVGDGRGVAGVVLGDLLLDLADQVRADVGGLGED